MYFFGRRKKTLHTIILHNSLLFTYGKRIKLKVGLQNKVITMNTQSAVKNGGIYEKLKDGCHKKDISRNNSSSGDDGSTNTETPSEPWFDEQDLLSHSDIAEEKQGVEDEDDVLYDFVTNCLDESKLKEKESDLYNDLIILENEAKKTKINSDFNYENLKQELAKLQESEALKNARILELSEENATLKKNICTLYRTAKSEIEYKDSLLADLNRKLDNLLFRKNLQYCRNCRNEKRGISDVERRRADNQFLDDRHGDGNYFKRKRLNDSPNSSYPGKESESAGSSSKPLTDKDSRTTISEQFTPQSHSSMPRSAKILQKTSSERDIETPETIKNSNNSRDSTGTNTLFFNLLPPPLKQAFYDYEQSEIISLNKLKQAFINQHFSYELHDQPPSLEVTPKRPRPLMFQSRNDKNFSGGVSVNSESIPMSSVHHSRKLDSTNSKPVTDSSPENTIKFGNYDCKVTKLMQQDIVTLFSYRKQKVPFLEKRKFGLLKNNTIGK